MDFGRSHGREYRDFCGIDPWISVFLSGSHKLGSFTWIHGSLWFSVVLMSVDLRRGSTNIGHGSGLVNMANVDLAAMGLRLRFVDYVG